MIAHVWSASQGHAHSHNGRYLLSARIIVNDDVYEPCLQLEVVVWEIRCYM